MNGHKRPVNFPSNFNEGRIMKPLSSGTPPLTHAYGGILARGCTATGQQSAAVGNRHDDDYLVGPRRVRQRHPDRIEVVKGPVIVLVAQGHVEAGAAGSDLHVGRYDRLSTADGGPHRLAEHGVNAGAAMLEFAIKAY